MTFVWYFKKNDAYHMTDQSKTTGCGASSNKYQENSSATHFTAHTE